MLSQLLAGLHQHFVMYKNRIHLITAIPECLPNGMNFCNRHINTREMSCFRHTTERSNKRIARTGTQNIHTAAIGTQPETVHSTHQYNSIEGLSAKQICT